jgi:cephalosporin-C deacetylase-like acetyl esterase
MRSHLGVGTREKFPTSTCQKCPPLDMEIQAVVDLRRGIDLLLARSDVDPKRLAYVGHSYGAQWGSILSALRTGPCSNPFKSKFRNPRSFDSTIESCSERSNFTR